MTDLSPQEEKSLYLFDGVLSRNLGLDVVVVLTKTDSMTQLESEHGLTDQHFDFIQQAVRKFCLTYGASLFFTSVKEDKNCDLLYNACNMLVIIFCLKLFSDMRIVPPGSSSSLTLNVKWKRDFRFPIYFPLWCLKRACSVCNLYQLYLFKAPLHVEDN